MPMIARTHFTHRTIILQLAALLAAFCFTSNAQTRLDAGAQIGHSSNLGRNGPSEAVSVKGVIDSARFALSSEFAYLFRDRKYTGQGSGYSFDAQGRFYVRPSERLKPFVTAGLLLRYNDAGLFSKTAAMPLIGGGVAVKSFTLQGSYLLPDFTSENKLHGLRFDAEHVAAINERFYVSVRGYVERLNFDNPHLGALHRSGTRAALTIAVGVKR